MVNITPVTEAGQSVASPFTGLYLQLRERLNAGTITPRRATQFVQRALEIAADAVSRATALLQELQRPEPPASAEETR
jgi:hypothetical protein